MQMRNNFDGCGIKDYMIDNFEDYKDIVKHLICCICLEIVKSPMECSKCETFYCGVCWEIIKMAGKQCVSKCDANTSVVKKANKFARELLSKLKFKCELCGKNGIIYDEFIKHQETCGIDPNLPTKEALIKIVLEKEQEIDNLSKEIESFKLSKITSMSKQDLRNMLVTNTLQTAQKMELYNSVIQGKTNDFKYFVTTKKYPLLEEVSAKTYYWTSLHYAMHYGRKDIIQFILESVKGQNLLEAAMQLESNDNRCPVLCLLRSNTINLDLKRDILDFLLGKFGIFLSNSVKKEVHNRNLDSVLKKYNKL